RERAGMIFGGDAAAQSDSGDDVSIMHMDIDGLSGRRRRGASPYEISLLMFGLYNKMSEYFYREYESLAFFMGGDNFMIICSDEARESGGRGFVDAVERQDGIRLNCGIGSGRNGREAAMRATESLDMIRKMRDESGGGAGSEGEWPRVYEHATGRRL
ncbi:MAG: GTP cyclohydrolase IIa, partial [Desulfovibrionales bacterium]|nr:GTP cyclohydrolase IIa [Desulfovibrionales bacterium]